MQAFYLRVCTYSRLLDVIHTKTAIEYHSSL
nr:MAG TPA_asm: hypothetical protein [Caudoviricetes sp.]